MCAKTRKSKPISRPNKTRYSYDKIIILDELVKDSTGEYKLFATLKDFKGKKSTDIVVNYALIDFKKFKSIQVTMDSSKRQSFLLMSNSFSNNWHNLSLKQREEILKESKYFQDNLLNLKYQMLKCLPGKNLSDSTNIGIMQEIVKFQEKAYLFKSEISLVNLHYKLKQPSEEVNDSYIVSRNVFKNQNHSKGRVFEKFTSKEANLIINNKSILQEIVESYPSPIENGEISKIINKKLSKIIHRNQKQMYTSLNIASKLNQ